MNIDFKYILLSLLSLVLLMTTVSCEDSGYFEDSKLNVSKNIDMTNYDYIASVGNYSQFTKAVDMAEFKDTINESDVTLLVAGDNSFKDYLVSLNVESIVEADTIQVRSFLKKYIFKQRILKSDIGSETKEFKPMSDATYYMSVRNGKWRGVDNIGPEYINILDKKDVSNDRDDVTAKTVTCDLQTKNGVIHVLTVDHDFGF